MSVTDYRTSRREDEAERRRQDREDRRAEDDARLERERLAQEAQDRRREQDREDRRERAQQELAAQQAREQQRMAERQAERDAKERADKVRRAEKARARKERRERRNQMVRSAPGWISEHLDISATVAVMACSIVPALISQSLTLHRMGLDIVLVLMIPVMLECSAWASNAAEAKALKEGRAAWPYRLMGWVFALFAGSVNYHTGLQIGGHGDNVVAGAILAATSLVPLGLYQMIQLGRHREAKARLKAERTRRRHESEDEKRRTKLYPKVWDAAVRLRAIAGHDHLSMQQAWTAAWAVFEGAGEALPADVLALLSAEMLGIRVDAEERLALILADYHRARAARLKASSEPSDGVAASASEESPEESVYVSAGEGVNPPTRTVERRETGLVDRHGSPLFVTVSPQINPFVPTSARTPEPAPAQTPERPRADRPRTRREPAGRALSEGAKKAASVSAKAASADENRAIEEWVAEQIRTGGEVSKDTVEAATLKLRTDANNALPPRKRAKIISKPGRTWIYDRINAGTKLATNGGLHIVRDTQRSA